jgi:hypothetical protein
VTLYAGTWGQVCAEPCVSWFGWSAVSSFFNRLSLCKRGWTATPPIRWTRDASRDIKPGCQDHHPAAIAPRPPLSDPQPIGRGARLLSQLRRRSRRRLSGTAALPIGVVDRNSGMTRFKHWRACWTNFRSGGTTCPPASKTARRRTRSMPYWISAVMSKSSRRSNCQRASDGTNGAHR